MSAIHAPKSSGSRKALALFVLLTLIVGAVAGVATVSNIQGWYATLNKPSFNPPNGVFGPVWTLLYILMSISAWRVWRAPGPEGLRRRALGFWSVQLALNFAWSFLFFALHRPGVALAEILTLLAAVALTLVLSWRVDRIAGMLLIPYLAWVAFASLLNFEIWRLN